MWIYQELFDGCLVTVLSVIFINIDWKLLYLTPLCFVGVFAWILSKFFFFAKANEHIMVFTGGQFAPNPYTVIAVQCAVLFAAVAAALLTLVVIALRR